ncbi:MAG: hypothetical protein QOJ64_1227 [Acidobacteriota bacterium]|nr:hypothetical protein [Acidobacteriota bacterium]
MAYLTSTRRAYLLARLALAALTTISSVPAFAQNCSQPSFKQPPIFPVGSDVRALTAADFDGDGKPDLAVANADSNSVTVVTGVEAGAPAHSNTYSVGTFPIAITAGDFNGDGSPDIVTGNNSAANISVLLNNGAGSFTAGGTFGAGSGPRWISAGDFNGDGLLDLAVATSSNTGILLGNGQGGFGSPINTGTAGGYVVAADFNNDSKLDLAIASTSVVILLGDGTGHFTSSCRAGPGTQGIAVGDLNADGKLDLVVADVPAAQIHAMLGDGAGCFGAPFNISVGNAGRPGYVAVGDLNNDGKLDIIGGTAVMLGNGNGTFGSPVAYGSGSVGPEPGSNTVLTDFDGDGNLDIATAGRGSVGILFGNGLGGFKFATGPDGGGAYGIARGDLNADGKLDLVLLSNGNVSRLLGDGSGGFGAPVIVPVTSSSSFQGLVIADFNRDGKLDVGTLDATHNGPGGLPRVHILLGDGSGGFASAISTSLNASDPAALAAGDLNGDGNPDVLLVNRGGGANNEGSILMALGDGAGHFGSPSIYSVPTPSNPKSLGIADFNGDGKIDLAIPSGFGFSILIADGVGGFGPRSHITTANGSSLAVADLNSDGRPDLAMVAQEQNGKLSVVLGDGSGGFGPPAQFTVGAFAEDITLADFNGDGKIDAGVTNGRESPAQGSLRSSVSVLFGDGAGGFGAASQFAADREPGHIVSGDFNNDGRPDLITANQTVNNISVLLNSCPAPLGSTNVQFSAANYVVAESATTATITVTRTGDTSAAATVSFATIDSAGLQNCNVKNGIASPRCDFIYGLSTVSFAAGEASKNVFVGIVDDSYAEGPENFTVNLIGASGATLGTPTTATVTIVDNDGSTDGPNPLASNDFFIRQHYNDFLGREPDPPGFAAWQNILNQCGITVSQPCDRTEVSSAFFRSAEFQGRGYFIYRFFPTVGKIPVYSEFTPDFAKVSGFLTDQQLEANKVAFVGEFMARGEFQTRYSSTFNNPTAYVDALLQTVGLPNHSARQGWIDQLNANNTAQKRGQVLRGLVESTEMYQKFYNEAFVIMQYFGYLRRTADASYSGWIQTMNSNGGDYRVMIDGFLNSAEYRQRFGP